MALRLSELRYRRPFESAKDGILILDASTGQITDINPFMVDLLGYTREEYLGKALWEIGTFEDVAASTSASSGFAGAMPDDEGGDLRLLAKPYRVVDLARLLREVLDNGVAKLG